MLAGREIYFELRQLGNMVKVTAVDARTGVEISVPVQAGMPESLMQSRALKRLEYVLKRDGYI